MKIKQYCFHLRVWVWGEKEKQIFWHSIPSGSPLLPLKTETLTFKIVAKIVDYFPPIIYKAWYGHSGFSIPLRARLHHLVSLESWWKPTLQKVWKYNILGQYVGHLSSVRFFYITINLNHIFWIHWFSSFAR